jgi:hypothetical protein
MKKSLLIMLLCFTTLGFTQTKDLESEAVVFAKPKPATHVKTVVKKSLGAKATGPHTAALSCTPSTTASVTGYYFYQGTTSGGESSTALNPTPVASCAYTVTGLTGMTIYYWTAKAYSPTSTAPGLSIASNEASATTPADSAPLPPTGLSVGTISQNKVPLKWRAPAQQNGYIPVAYELFRGTTVNPTTLIAILPESTLTYVDTGCKKFPCYYGTKSYDIYNMKFELSTISNIVEAE